MKKYEILLVDDDPVILKGVKKNLNKQGWYVATAENGEEALDMLEGNGFDLVITDLAMDEIDGIEVLRRAKQLNPDSMVIIFTGYADMKSAVDSLRLGADDYMIKPCEPEEIFFRVENCLNKLELKKKIKEQTAELKKMNDELMDEIDERITIEGELWESEQKYRLLVESSLQGIMIVKNFQFQFVNPSIAEIMGYTTDELRTLSKDEVLGLMHPAEQPLIMKRINNFIQTDQESLYLKHRAVRKDGESRWIEAYVIKIGYHGDSEILASAIDITEKIEAQEALKDSEEKFMSLFQTVPLSIIRIDKVGRIENVSPLFLEKYTAGKTAANDCIGCDISAVLAFREDRCSAVMKKLLNGEAIYETGVKGCGLPNGANAYFAVKGEPLTACGKYTGAVILIED